YLEFEAGDLECPPSRPIGPHFPPTARVLEVYLAVPKELEGIPSVSDERPGAAAGVGGGGGGGTATTSDTKAARARYRAISRQVADLGGTAADVQIAFA